ncbi:MAG TPA: neutral/alkaline non-lysosomal ceramidase N-terminal domain-containing protein [Candidatus Hydrogenedentes bacterium]|nr:neutral/alkaline non-lysosomal ceramidase N-terminal domain-containing protein [Candidatus Hydrogenedentota bacterium]
MRKMPEILGFLLLFAALDVCVGGRCHALEAGAAKADITPPLGTPLNGYGSRMGRGATSVHDPLWARCLYLNDGETSLFLINADLCIINRELRARVLELAPPEVKPQNIILTATHTHSGTGATVKQLVFRAVAGRFMPEVLEQTAQGFAKAMREAYEDRKRAAIGYGTGEQHDFTLNRRETGGPIDPQIGVIRVDDADGSPIAIVTNLAAHPTTVHDDDLYAISAEYPGYYYETLEKLVGGHCVAMFLNGAEGNQRPTNPENKDHWGRVESLGRILAERAKSIADTITCGDHKLHLACSTPDMPLSLASTLVFPSTILHALEIGDLLLTFLPGEPCVEIGLELRKRALARGYAAQFSVGLSNDHLMYFVPPEYYGRLYYETASNFYGPGMMEWFCREFSKLMTKGEPEPDRPIPEPAVLGEVEGGLRCAVSGDAYAMGYQRGAAFKEEIGELYRARLVVPMDEGKLKPSSQVWKYLQAARLDVSPLLLFAMAMGVRPLLQGLSMDTLDELRGMADAACLPFDSLWMLQCASIITAQPTADGFYRAPLCTMFAAVGDHAGAGELLVARNLDWDEPEKAVIVEAKPASGHAFAHVGFAWNAGVFTGMNDAGLILCAERVESLGVPSIDAPPVEFVLREILQNEENLSAAVSRLQGYSTLRGYHVLAAGFDMKSPPPEENEKEAKGRGRKRSSLRSPAKKTGDACVLEFGARVNIRHPDKGILLGVDPASATDENDRIRYGRVAELVGGEHIVGAGKMKTILADHEIGKPEPACIWNRNTRQSVVFEPSEGMVHAAFPGDDGMPGDYTSVSVKGGAR